MKIYVAAKYQRRHELRDLHDRLIAMGHEPTSRWIDVGEEGMGQEAAAVMDYQDVERADAVLFIGQPTGSENRGGGRWFELGAAFALGKRCLAVLDGGRETVFTALRTIEEYRDVEDALSALS